MRCYEIAYLVAVSRNWDVTTFFNGIDSLVRANNGRVLKHESWGKRNLAYRVKNNSTAFFYCLHIECDIGLLAKIREKFWSTNVVLRHLVTKRLSKDGSYSQNNRPTADTAQLKCQR